MKSFMDVIAQWLSFVYIICAIFGAVFFKGISLPFFTKQHTASVKPEKLNPLVLLFEIS